MKKSLSILLVLSLLVVSMASVMVFAESDSDVVLISENTEADKVADSAADEEADKAADSAADEEADKAADSAADEEADKAADSAAEEEANKAADSAADEETTEATEEITFADVDETDWAYNAIKALAKKGVISGDADKNLRPDSGITREEVAKIVVEGRGIEIDKEAVIDATDADSVSSWAKSYVATAVKEGILKGYEDNTIRSSKVVTRAEMATILVRSIGATADFDSSSFNDVEDAWYAADVECAKNLGIVTGYEDGSFKGDNTVTRREAFAMAHRVISLVEALENN